MKLAIAENYKKRKMKEGGGVGDTYGKHIDQTIKDWLQDVIGGKVKPNDWKSNLDFGLLSPFPYLSLNFEKVREGDNIVAFDTNPINEDENGPKILGRFPLKKSYNGTEQLYVDFKNWLKSVVVGKMKGGGNTYAKEDKEMLHSQVKQIKHHAEEMDSVIDKQKHIEPWVVSKMGRTTSDLSDVNHYLDGRLMKRGGELQDQGNEMAIYTNKALNETHKMGGLRDLGHAWNMVESVSKRKGWNPIDVHVTLEKKMKEGGSTEDFRVDGYMTLSNSGGIEIELDNRGDGLRYRFNNNGNYTEPEETFIAFDDEGEAMFMDGDTVYHLSDFMRAYAKGCMMETGGSAEEYRKGGNITSIEKRVAEVNEMIKKGNELGIEVIDESGTWQAPMKYKPIKYSNGILYIEYDQLDLYKHNKGQGSIWKTEKLKVLKSEMSLRSYEPGAGQKEALSDIAKMYRKGLNHYEKYGYYAKGGGVEDVTKLIPIYTKRDKSGYRFYVDSKDGNKLYAEKNRTLYKVNDDLKPSIRAVRDFDNQDEKFSGILPEEHFKDLEPLHYERMGVNRVAKSFNIRDKMKHGGGVGDDQLNIVFSRQDMFEKAKDFYENESAFYPSDVNDEFRTFVFDIENGEADVTEYYMEQELQDTDLDGYYFEIADKMKHGGNFTGKLMGHTKTGKPIYDERLDHHSYDNYTKEDRSDMERAFGKKHHQQELDEKIAKANKMKEGGEVGEYKRGDVIMFNSTGSKWTIYKILPNLVLYKEFNGKYMQQLSKEAFEERLKKKEIVIIKSKMKEGGRAYGLGLKVGSLIRGTKRLGRKGVDATKKAVRDQQKKVALNVIDETKDKVSDNKGKMILKGAEEIVGDKYKRGGGMKEGYWVESKKTNFGYAVKTNRKDKGLETISYHKTKAEANREVEKLNAQSKVGKVMHEFKEGELHSGSKKGPIVTDRKQAVAIALSEAGISKDDKPTGWKHKRKK